MTDSTLPPLSYGLDGAATIVTGAGSGLGRETATRLARAGARVACFDVNTDGVEETVATLTDAGAEAIAIGVDVTDETAVDAAVTAVTDVFGGLDVTVNCAGIGGFSHTLELPFERFKRALDVNLSGTFLMCQKTLPHLLRSERWMEPGDGHPGGLRGAIVNTASIAGLRGQAYSAAYSASKGGVVLLTKALSVEFATKRVRVNCVAPGGIATPLLAQFMPPEDANPHLVGRIGSPFKRMAEPSEIANAIVWLASPQASYVSGTALIVDGATLT